MCNYNQIPLLYSKILFDLIERRALASSISTSLRFLIIKITPLSYDKEKLDLEGKKEAGIRTKLSFNSPLSLLGSIIQEH